MTHELTQRAIEAWNAKGDASVEDRMEAVLSLAFEEAAKIADAEADEHAASAEHWRCSPEGSAAMERFDRCQARAWTAGSIAMQIRALSATPSPVTGEREPFNANTCQCPKCGHYIKRG